MGKHQIKVNKAVMLKGLQLQLSNPNFAWLTGLSCVIIDIPVSEFKHNNS